MGKSVSSSVLNPYPDQRGMHVRSTTYPSVSQARACSGMSTASCRCLVARQSLGHVVVQFGVSGMSLRADCNAPLVLLVELSHLRVDKSRLGSKPWMPDLNTDPTEFIPTTGGCGRGTAFCVAVGVAAAVVAGVLSMSVGWQAAEVEDDKQQRQRRSPWSADPGHGAANIENGTG